MARFGREVHGFELLIVLGLVGACAGERPQFGTTKSEPDAGDPDAANDSNGSSYDASSVDASNVENTSYSDAGSTPSTLNEAAPPFTPSDSSANAGGSDSATDESATGTDGTLSSFDTTQASSSDGNSTLSTDATETSLLDAGATSSTDGDAFSPDSAVEKPDCTECEPIPVVTGLFSVSDFTVLGPLIYYSDAIDEEEGPIAGPLMKVPVTGGTSTKVTQANLPAGNNHLIGVGSQIFAAPDAIWTVPILGAISATELEGSPNYVTDLRVNGTHMFARWSLSQAYVTRVPLAGGTANSPARTPSFDWLDFEVDEEYVYLLTEISLARVPVSGTDGGSTAEVGPVATSGEALVDLALTGDGALTIASSLFLTSYSSWDTEPTVLFEEAVAEVVSNTTHAYFFAPDPDGCEDGAELYEVAYDGGRVRRLATLSACPRSGSVTHDANRVYWLSEDATEILAAEK